jgi:formylmethanofuran dehydrogenase subunit E
MGILDPDDFTVECDECGEQKQFSSTEYVGKLFGVDEKTLDEEGWEEKDGQILCPSCLGYDEEEQCAGCGEMFEESDLDRDDLCSDCAQEKIDEEEEDED